MFNSLVFTWERNSEVTFGIFSVIVSQINVLESYLSVLKLVMIKKCENCDNLDLLIKVLPIFRFYQKILQRSVSFCTSLIFMYCLCVEKNS